MSASPHIKSPTTQYVLPSPLSLSSKVAIVAPSGPVDSLALQNGIRQLPFPTKIFPGALGKDGFWSGSVQQRARDLQAALDDPDIDAILCARGGFGVTTILDQLDFSHLMRKPKWIIGNSDITALLLHLWATHKMCSIHGPMAARLSQYSQQDAGDLVRILRGDISTVCDSLHPLCSGTASGPLIGGNLTMIAHMMGTLPAGFASGCILFLEDVGEHPYRIERCILQLRRNHLFDDVRGIILGEFTNCHPGPDGVTVTDVVARNLLELDVPVAGGYPAAHGTRNRPFIHGQPIRLSVSKNDAFIEIDTERSQN